MADFLPCDQIMQRSNYHIPSNISLTWFQIVVNNRRFYLVQILEGTDSLQTIPEMPMNKCTRHHSLIQWSFTLWLQFTQHSSFPAQVALACSFTKKRCGHYKRLFMASSPHPSLAQPSGTPPNSYLNNRQNCVPKRVGAFIYCKSSINL